MIVDTNVVAYAIIGVEEYEKECFEVLEEADEIIVPESFRAELLSVLWQWAERDGLDDSTLTEYLRDCDELIGRTVPTSEIWESALEMALEASHSPYDTLFVAAAKLFDSPLVSCDDALVRKFPKFALRPSDVIGG